MGFWDQKFVSNSDIGSVWSGRPGLRSYEAKSDVAALLIAHDRGKFAHFSVQIGSLRRVWSL